MFSLVFLQVNEVQLSNINSCLNILPQIYESMEYTIFNVLCIRYTKVFICTSETHSCLL